MSATRYAKAPITEAIIDLRVEPREGLTPEIVEAVRDGEEAAYPEVHKINIAHGELEIGERLSASAAQHQIGISSISADKKQVFQSRIDGFTFSRLAPYETWEPFRNEARRLWTSYRERVKPSEIKRLAVRYINRFDLPGTQVELKDYFRTTPEISPDLPQVMNGFFFRVVLPENDLKGQVLINETIIRPEKPDVVSVVLDIDLFREVDVPNDEESIWDYFEKLRIRKDQVFEACITDRARELIH